MRAYTFKGRWKTQEETGYVNKVTFAEMTTRRGCWVLVVATVCYPCHNIYWMPVESSELFSSKDAKHIWERCAKYSWKACCRCEK